MSAGAGTKIARARLGAVLDPIAVEPGYRSVLLLVEVAGAIVGQVWLQARPVITPEAQWQAITAELGPVVWTEALRGRLATAAPVPDPSRTRPEPAVTVVICTRDRPERLTACLDSLEALATAPAEVIVVDNAPSDEATRRLCRSRPVRYLREPTPGQSRARNRGIASSAGGVIAFTDDDCVVDRRWLDGLGREFADPLTMVVTGYVGPQALETEAQRWFELHGGFERHPSRRLLDQETTTPLRGAAGAGAGANMIFRRTAFDRVGAFSEALGPGTPARSGDDKDAFYRVLRSGFRIVQDPGRMVWHHHRADPAALRRVLDDHLTAEFAYTTRCLLEDRELDALALWKWWGRHLLGDLVRHGRRSPRSVPLWITAAELRGALAGPARLRRSIASRRGIEPIAIPAARPERDARISVGSEGPRLHVAIASLQRSDSLRRVLAGLAEQRYPSDRFRVVVVLDGSTDGSAEMVRSLEVPYELRAVDERHAGLASARDRGAREADAGEVVVLLDDDVDPAPDFLAAHAEAHAGTEGLVALGYYPPAGSTDPSLWEQRLRGWWEDHFRRKADPAHQWMYVDLVDGNLSLRLETLLDAGGYDLRFRGGRRQDWELGMRLLQRGARFEYHPRARGEHRLDTTLEAALAHARDEGRWDVLLAREHPQTKGHLPLSMLARGSEGRPRRSAVLAHRALGPLSPRAVLPVLAALERANLRTRWRRLLDRALFHAYTQGVFDALGGSDEVRTFLDPEEIRRTTVRIPLDLEAPAPLEVPPGAGAIEVAIEVGGAPIATVPATEPAGQWDWPGLTDRAVGRAAANARLGLALRGLGPDPPRPGAASSA